MSALDYFSPAAIDEMIAPSDRYTVVAVAQTQQLSGDRLYDAVEITFTVTGRPGAFTFVFPFAGWRSFESPIELTSEAQIVDDLYNIAV